MVCVLFPALQGAGTYWLPLATVTPGFGGCGLYGYAWKIVYLKHNRLVINNCLYSKKSKKQNKNYRYANLLFISSTHYKLMTFNLSRPYKMEQISRGNKPKYEGHPLILLSGTIENKKWHWHRCSSMLSKWFVFSMLFREWAREKEELLTSCIVSLCIPVPAKQVY